MKKAYKCQAKGCKYSTKIKASLTHHRNGHKAYKKIKPQSDVQCPQCDWKGKHGSLRKHIRSKHI